MTVHVTYILWRNTPLFEDTSDIIFEEKKDLPLLEEIGDALLIHPSKKYETDIIWFLNILRKNSIKFLVPVFFTPVPSDILQALSNGIIHTVDEIKNQVIPFLNRQQQIRSADMTHQDARLLAHAYVFRSNFQPMANDVAPLYYHFPLAETLADTDTDIFSWLEFLTQKGLLTKKTLVDRVRTCPQCTSAHLHFLDICPSCNSLRIQKDIFLHCFVCGHVASQSSFIVRDLLQCPSCHAKLRHIGSDYDRALETYSCKDCASIFSEPHIVARCMKCGIQAEPENLIPLEICPYSLSSKGETVALVGWQETPFALLDNLNFIALDYFTYLLSWLMQLQHRYSDNIFSVLGLRFLNLEKLAQHMGSSRLAKLLDAFVRRLREIIRTTDVVSRSGPDLIWVILPRTSKEGCEVLQNRIQQLIKDAQQEDDNYIMVAQTGWTSDPTNAFEDPHFLLAHLASLLKND